MPKLEEIRIRNDFVPGDLGYVIHLHGLCYGREYRYGVGFEMYVAEGMSEFVRRYDPARDRVWICEHEQSIVGFLLLMHREHDAAQLRYFLIIPEYRGIGLGKKLMDLSKEFLHRCQYRSSYLWTTDELTTAATLYKRCGFRLTDEKESSSFGKLVREQRYEVTF